MKDQNSHTVADDWCELIRPFYWITIYQTLEQRRKEEEEEEEERRQSGKGLKEHAAHVEPRPTKGQGRHMGAHH